jgi:CheY-like chemotaxis protein
MTLSTRLVTAMVALVVLSAAIIGAFTHRNIETVVIPRSLESIESRARLLALELEASLRGPYADVVGFRSAVAVEGIVRASLSGAAQNGISLAQWRDRLAARFVAELAVKPNYSQFRIIGVADGGREIIRVDRSGPGKTIRVVPDTGLEQRGDSDYFQRAIRLGPNEVDVSPIELNQEQGVVELPHVPVIRPAAAIHTPDGRPFGIVVINVDLGAEFARIRAARRPDSQIFVVNERGDYLLHPDQSREFGFAFAKPQRLDDDFPDLAGVATAPAPLSRIVRDRAGAVFGVALVPARLAQGPLVAVAEAVPHAHVIAPAIAVRNSILAAGLAAVLLAVILAVLLAQSLTRPLVAMTRAVEAFGRGERMRVPADASGEIGTLSNAFARMAAEVQEKSAALTQETAERRRLFETSLDLIVVADPQGVLVEDDRMVRDYVEAQPTSLGYSTLAAANAAEALEHVKLGAQFDLLFTDVIMPGMNGRELAEEVARLRPGTRVLFTSGYTEDAIVHHGRLDPGVALLNKRIARRIWPRSCGR